MRRSIRIRAQQQAEPVVLGISIEGQSEARLTNKQYIYLLLLKWSGKACVGWLVDSNCFVQVP